MSRTVVWFSCGAASAVAAKLTLAHTPGAKIIRCAIAEEHEDNDRFTRDCEAWLGVKVTTLTNRAYASDTGYASIYEVFRKERYLVGPDGAHCTKKLKKALREQWERHDDIQVFGYTCEEQNRVDRYPLVEKNLTKADCLALVERAGIQLPAMYRLGYANNNCIGCVKGGAGYWNRIRVDFPEVFERMAKMEEYLGRKVNRISVDGVKTRVSLRQLPLDVGNFQGEQPSDCGPFCLVAEEAFVPGGAE